MRNRSLISSIALILLAVPTVLAGRCSYKELKRPEPLEIRPRRCTGAGSFIGEDYWTTIGYDGSLKDNRQTSDFLTFDQAPVADGYIAYWITRTRYGNTHYEAFGHATIRDDGRVCAWFVGLDKEIVEVCGGFRVLSRSRFRPQNENPFEWTQAHLDAKSTLGFHEHRIAKYDGPEEEVIYGDARIQNHNYQGVSGRDSEEKSFVEVTGPEEFAQRIWLLRRKPGIPAAAIYQAFPRLSSLDERRNQISNDFYDEQRTESRGSLDSYSYQQQQYMQQQQQYYQQQKQRQLEQRQRVQEQRLREQQAHEQRLQEQRVRQQQAQELRQQAEGSEQHHIGHGARPIYAEQQNNERENRLANSENEGRNDSPQRFARIQAPQLIRDQYGNTYEKREGFYFLYSDPHIQNVRINGAASNGVNTAEVVDERYADENYRRHMESLRRIHEERRQNEERRRQQWDERKEQPQRVSPDESERTTYVGDRRLPEVERLEEEASSRLGGQDKDGWQVQETNEQQTPLREDGSEDPVPFDETEDKEEADEMDDVTPQSLLPSTGPIYESSEKKEDWMLSRDSNEILSQNLP
ncbi:unnamed protein product [Auanema sp. JU1783]|nr:unnamed protein product [Auanema sp. JU1783]